MSDLKFASILFDLIKKMYINQIVFNDTIIIPSSKSKIIDEYKESIADLQSRFSKLPEFSQDEMVYLLTDMQKRLESKYDLDLNFN